MAVLTGEELRAGAGDGLGEGAQGSGGGRVGGQLLPPVPLLRGRGPHLVEVGVRGQPQPGARVRTVGAQQPQRHPAIGARGTCSRPPRSCSIRSSSASSWLVAPDPLQLPPQLIRPLRRRVHPHQLLQLDQHRPRRRRIPTPSHPRLEQRAEPVEPAEGGELVGQRGVVGRALASGSGPARPGGPPGRCRSWPPTRRCWWAGPRRAGVHAGRRRRAAGGRLLATAGVLLREPAQAVVLRGGEVLRRGSHGRRRARRRGHRPRGLIVAGRLVGRVAVVGGWPRTTIVVPVVVAGVDPACPRGPWWSSAVWALSGARAAQRRRVVDGRDAVPAALGLGCHLEHGGRAGGGVAYSCLFARGGGQCDECQGGVAVAQRSGERDVRGVRRGAVASVGGSAEAGGWSGLPRRGPRCAAVLRAVRPGCAATARTGCGGSTHGRCAAPPGPALARRRRWRAGACRRAGARPRWVAPGRPRLCNGEPGQRHRRFDGGAVPGCGADRDVPADRSDAGCDVAQPAALGVGAWWCPSRCRRRRR